MYPIRTWTEIIDGCDQKQEIDTYPTVTEPGSRKQIQDPFIYIYIHQNRDWDNKSI